MPECRPAREIRPALEYCIVDLYDDAGHWADCLAIQGDSGSVTLDLRTLAMHLSGRRFSVMLIRHGHPSGVAEPSQDDIAATRSVAELGRLLGVRLHDHVIEAGHARFSFRAAGLL